jgi:hypothetical protein
MYFAIMGLIILITAGVKVLVKFILITILASTLEMAGLMKLRGALASPNFCRIQLAGMYFLIPIQ